MCIHYEVWLFSITENLNVVYLRRKKSKVLVAQLCPIPCDPMAPTDHQAPLSMNSPGKNTGVGSHSLLQKVFPTQGPNPGLPLCKRILYCQTVKQVVESERVGTLNVLSGNEGKRRRGGKG